MWTSEKEKDGQRSDTSVHEYCVQFSEFCCSLSLGAKNIFFMSFYLTNDTHTQLHTHTLKSVICKVPLSMKVIRGLFP